MASEIGSPDVVSDATRTDRRATLRWMAFDLTVVLSFVAVGRDTHNEAVDIASIARTAAPFLTALLVAWSIPSLRKRPAALLTGISAGFVTAVLGMVLRRTLFDQGLSGAFPFVAAAYLIGIMTLGRLAAGFVMSRR